MPLPSVLNGAMQCQVMTKRTKTRCKNPAAYGCKACRMHGAHKSRKVPRGSDHSGYKNGVETKEAKSERSEKSVAFRYLADIGNHYNLFNKELKLIGRPPSEYIKLDLSDRNNLFTALAKTILKTKN